MVRGSRQRCVKNRIRVTLIPSFSQSLFICLLEIMSKQTPKLQPSGNFYTQINLASLTHSIWPFSNGFSQWDTITSYLWAPSANRYILCQNCVWVQSVFLFPFIIFVNWAVGNIHKLLQVRKFLQSTQRKDLFSIQYVIICVCQSCQCHYF